MSEPPKLSNNKASKVIIILSIIIAAISAYILFYVEIPDKPNAGKGGDKNITTNSALIGGDFVLTDYNDQEFNSDKLKGKLTLIYFGFTYCPDVCPTSMQKLSLVLEVLDKYHIDINPVFITVDPDRDSAALLKEYLNHFHPKIIGLTGSKSQIKQVADLFKVYYAKAASSGDEENDYMVDHSSFTYLMDEDGNYLKHFYLSSKAEEIVEFIRINYRK
ncbi:MAG: SCO family protein [Rickettsiaceae bacterium]|nr:SCO family protein [Rickettsiaceae bacterium]